MVCNFIWQVYISPSNPCPQYVCWDVESSFHAHCADPDLLTGRFVDSIYFDLKGDPMYVMSTDGVLSRTHTSTYLCIGLGLVISSYLHVSTSR